MSRFVVLTAALAALLAVLVAAGFGGKLDRTNPERAAQELRLRLVPVASGLRSPLGLTAPPRERDRLYVAEQIGRIRVIVNGRLRAAPFLDIRRLVTSGGEQGLLGLAFHPNYARNRRFYVHYTDRNGDTRVVEYRSNGARAITRSARRLLFVNQPYPNHNGGQLAFGPDGYLYVGLGDGGSGGDPENRAQNLRTRLGKLLRINVNRRPARVQIVGYGLRNPWRFSFDRQTGDLYIGDVGQGAWEEIDYTPRRSPGLENYGWDVYEGRARFENKAPNPVGRLVFPITVYSIGGSRCTVIGGFVYRGSSMPLLRGRYFYGDYCTGEVWSLRVANGNATGTRLEPFRVNQLSSFGEDARGELYLVSLGGRVYRLAAS